jgi:homoserine kinase type II
MAVYTEVSDDAIARFIASYDLGKLTSCKGVAEGVENTNYAIHTERGPYFLTLFEKRVARTDLPFFLGLMEHLAARGISCPLPVRDRQGRMLRELAHKPAALVTFLEGISHSRLNTRHCAAVGEALAGLHVAGLDFPLKRKNALSVVGWRPLFQGFARNADAIGEGLAATIEAELGHLEALWPKGLAGGVIHADLFPDNVLFLDTKVSGLIDFYFACNDMLAYDIAICLNCWCFEAGNAFNVTKGRALLKAYDKVRRIAPEELAALPTLARGAALRFLLTRAYDRLNTPKEALVRPKDPLEYLRKLRFHQGIRSAAEYGYGGSS